MPDSDPYFAGRFLVASADRAVPRGFDRHPLTGDLTLFTDRSLRVTKLRQGTRERGMVLGAGVDLESGTCLDARLDLPEDLPGDADVLADHLLDRLSGSFLLFIKDKEGWSCHPDASATIGLVYDPARGVAGSNALQLLGEEYDKRLQTELVSAFGARRDGWFTAGLTAHRGLYRLLPNHRLDLSDWRVRRSAPAMPPYVGEVDRVLTAIGSEIATVTRAFMAKGDVHETLTGGHDARLVLAANRALARDIEFITLAFSRASRDLSIARRLAAIAGLRHRAVAPIRATPAQQAAWEREAGHTLAGMNRTWHPSVARFAGSTLIGGLGGEFGRGFLWGKGIGSLEVEDILDRLKLPRHSVLVEAVGLWRTALPQGLDDYQILDLAYCELRNGPWAFAQPRLRRSPQDIHPLISRRNLLRMWSLPPDFRRDNGMPRRMVELLWPELGAVPVNAFGDWRDKTDLLVRGLRNPGRAVRKARLVLAQRRDM